MIKIIRIKNRFIVVILTLFVFVGCDNNESVNTYEEKNIEKTKQIKVIEEDKENINEITTNAVTTVVENKDAKTSSVTIGVVGDIMYHQRQLQRGYNMEDDSFDFSNSFEQVSKYISDFDIALGNLETTLSGKDNAIRLENSNYFKGYQGYPCFNTPEVLADNLKEVGFDLFTTANNHSMDSWTGGISDTLDQLDRVGIKHVGTYRTEESQKYLIEDVNGIKIGYLSYTYGTNGINLPIDKKYLVNTLEMYNEDKMEEMYRQVKEMNDIGVDVLTVFIHFGTEYENLPSNKQKEIVNNLFENGADIVLGSHPHVLQPIEIRKVEKNGEEYIDKVAIYSLGNFISSQRYTNNEPINKDVGMILGIEVEKDTEENTYIKEIKMLPTWVQWTKKEIRVIPVDEAILNYKNKNMLKLTEKDYNRLEDVKKRTVSHLMTLDKGEVTKKNEFYYID